MKLPKFSIELRDSDPIMPPVYYGFVCRHEARCTTVFAIVPFNWLWRWGRSFWDLLRYGGINRRLLARERRIMEKEESLRRYAKVVLDSAKALDSAIDYHRLAPEYRQPHALMRGVIYEIEDEFKSPAKQNGGD